jgi:hypothetical protein
MFHEWGEEVCVWVIGGKAKGHRQVDTTCIKMYLREIGGGGY